MAKPSITVIEINEYQIQLNTKKKMNDKNKSIMNWKYDSIQFIYQKKLIRKAFLIIKRNE